jgi:formylglycine-generating enzyme required for sulfatase activity
MFCSRLPTTVALLACLFILTCSARSEETIVGEVDPAVVGAWRSVLPDSTYISLWIGAGGDFRTGVEGVDPADDGGTGTMTFRDHKFTQTDKTGTDRGDYSITDGVMSITVGGQTMIWLRSSHDLTDGVPTIEYRMLHAGKKGIDPGTLGSWTCVVPEGNARIALTRTMDEEGHLKLSYPPSLKRPDVNGTAHFANGTFVTTPDGQPADQGTYVLRDADTLVVTGTNGTQTWLRFYPSPAAPTGVKKLTDQAVADLKALKKTPGQTWTNSASITLAYVPAGTFVRGKYKVTLSKDFMMSATPVTQAQWNRLVGENPCPQKGDDLPVDSVSWQEAQSYCTALSNIEGRHYRLPTEAEWEYACRAGTNTEYANGNGEAALAESDWYAKNSGGKMHPVGQKKPNAWGIYDCNGNVSLWCLDVASNYPDFDVTDPIGTGSLLDRVTRGGTCGGDAKGCIVSNARGTFPANRVSTGIGFRICLELPQSAVQSSAPKFVAKPSTTFPPGHAGECWTNSIGMSMAYIPPGTFMKKPDLGPLYKITISKSSLMAVTPVTQAQWTQIMGENPSTTKGDELPVDMVSYDDAVAFCQKLTQKEGKYYRLPTECEYEYACRAGTTGRFSTGDDTQALNVSGWFRGNAAGKTHPVGQKAPNPWGLYDMQGNVWEWCQNWANNPFQKFAPVDPPGNPKGKLRMTKGGAFDAYTDLCAAESAQAHPPEYKAADLGFRPMLDLSSAPPPAVPVAIAPNAPVKLPPAVAVQPPVPVRPDAPQPGQEVPPTADELKQHDSLYISTTNEVFLYQFQAFPGFWSEAVVAPGKVRHVEVACEDPSQVQMQMDNRDASITGINCAPATRFRFRAKGNKPVAIAVRFLRRDYLPGESSTFAMPAYPPAQSDAPTPARQALRDEITTMIQQKGEFDGFRSGDDPVHLHLVMTGKNGLITGWILFPNSKNKKQLEGRIIDDQTTAPTLQLVETRMLQRGPGGFMLGMVYWLGATPDHQGLKGEYYSHNRPGLAVNPSSIALTLTRN